MLFLPGIVVWLPALELSQTEEAAGNIWLILTGAVDKPSFGHLQRQAARDHVYDLLFLKQTKTNI